MLDLWFLVSSLALGRDRFRGCLTVLVTVSWVARGVGCFAGTLHGSSIRRDDGLRSRVPEIALFSWWLNDELYRYVNL